MIGHNDPQINRLVPEDTNHLVDTYRVEIETGAIDLVSLAADGGPANGESYPPADISGDGRYVTFTSPATNLATGIDDDNDTGDVFVRDMITGTTSYVSLAHAGKASNGWSLEPSISRTGKYVVFTSFATDLAPGGGERKDVFRADLQSGGITLVSSSYDGSPSDGESFDSMVSGNGRFVVFTSEAENLVPAVTHDVDDVYLYDSSSDETYVVSHGWDGSPVSGSAYGSTHPVIGGSSRWVLFQSVEDNIVRHDERDSYEVFFYRITKVGLRSTVPGE